MSETQNKELIVKPTVPSKELDNFLAEIEDHSIILNIDPRLVHRKKFKTIFESRDADQIICKDLTELKSLKGLGKAVGYYKKIEDNNDLEDILKASLTGAEFIIADAINWKIIPLENIVAKLRESKTKIYGIANNSEELRTLFGVLEIGVDGVILSTDDPTEIIQSKRYLNPIVFPIRLARIQEVKDVGMGERVCVDTISMLHSGEGMLVGSRSNFMFLIHNESLGSSFTSPRPFRVNAGAVYCYTLTSDGRTKYLSELEGGTEILIVNQNGTTRPVTVGRSKIETRPLRLIRAGFDKEQESGTVILQNAETIRFITKGKKLLAITDAKIGDEILVSIQPQTGRHFGMTVQEYILEK